jgi:hypothetical protein
MLRFEAPRQEMVLLRSFPHGKKGRPKGGLRFHRYSLYDGTMSVASSRSVFGNDRRRRRRQRFAELVAEAGLDLVFGLVLVEGDGATR